MEKMDNLNPEIAHLFVAKEERRRKLASLPFPEKIRIIVELQKIVTPILQARGKKTRIWSIHP